MTCTRNGDWRILIADSIVSKQQIYCTFFRMEGFFVDVIDIWALDIIKKYVNIHKVWVRIQLLQKYLHILKTEHISEAHLTDLFLV